MRIGYGLRLLAALGIAIYALNGGDLDEPTPAEVPPPVVTTSPQAPTKSPRPQARECAGTVTNNPAIQDWRRSIGC